MPLRRNAVPRRADTLPCGRDSLPAQPEIPVQESVLSNADALLRLVEKANHPIVIACDKNLPLLVAHNDKLPEKWFCLFVV